MSEQPEYLYRFGRWADRPTRHRIIARSAKTLTCVQDDPLAAYVVSHEYRVRGSQVNVGDEWYWTPAAAWVSRERLIRKEIEATTARLQKLRSEHGAVLSELKRQQKESGV